MKSASPIEYKDGDIIFREGEPSDCAFEIIKGQVEIAKSSSDGAVELAVLEPGEMLGEMGLLDHGDRSATAKAVGGTKLRIINREEFLAFLKDKPEGAIDIMGSLARRLRVADEMLAYDSPPRHKESNTAPAKKALAKKKLAKKKSTKKKSTKKAPARKKSRPKKTVQPKSASVVKTPAKSKKTAKRSPVKPTAELKQKAPESRKAAAAQTGGRTKKAPSPPRAKTEITDSASPTDAPKPSQQAKAKTVADSTIKATVNVDAKAKAVADARAKAIAEAAPADVEVEDLTSGILSAFGELVYTLGKLDAKPIDIPVEDLSDVIVKKFWLGAVYGFVSDFTGLLKKSFGINVQRRPKNRHP